MSSGSEEARRIKQRIHECNEVSQDQWRGFQSSTHIPIPNHGWASSTDAKNSCTLFHEWAIREASKAIRLWISYWRVILWSLCGSHGEASRSREDWDWGNDTSCCRADRKKLRFKDFFRHPLCRKGSRYRSLVNTMGSATHIIICCYSLGKKYTLLRYLQNASLWRGIYTYSLAHRSSLRPLPLHIN